MTIGTSESQRLEALGAAAPGAPGFAALAEARRREGRADEALELAEEGLRARPDVIAGRIVRVRALIDLGRVAEAQAELGRVLERVPDHPLAPGLGAALESRDPGVEAPAWRAPMPDDSAAASFADLAENELEAAFEEAEARPEEMLDANRVAEATLRDVEEEGPEGSLDRGDSPFATETMAQLLEKQGHAEKAGTLRARMHEAAAEAAPAGDETAAEARGTGSERARVLGTLERWLANLRRNS